MSYKTRVFFVACLASAFWTAAFAATGSDNPTGVTGSWNGEVVTAGEYDPLTGNARREITDLVVQGSVGAYPLQWKRYGNTRHDHTWKFS